MVDVLGFHGRRPCIVRVAREPLVIIYSGRAADAVVRRALLLLLWVRSTRRIRHIHRGRHNERVVERVLCGR